MKKYFKSRIEAIDWIACYAKDEGQFEVLREQMNFNFIYTGKFFVCISETKAEVVMLGNR